MTLLRLIFYSIFLFNPTFSRSAEGAWFLCGPIEEILNSSKGPKKSDPEIIFERGNEGIEEMEARAFLFLDRGSLSPEKMDLLMTLYKTQREQMYILLKDARFGEKKRFVGKMHQVLNDRANLFLRAQEFTDQRDLGLLSKISFLMTDERAMIDFVDRLYRKGIYLMLEPENSIYLQRFLETGKIPEEIYETILLQILRDAGFSGDMIETSGKGSILLNDEFKRMLRDGKVLKDGTFRGEDLEHGVYIHMFQLAYVADTLKTRGETFNLVDFYKRMGILPKAVSRVWDTFFDGGSEVYPFSAPESLNPVLMNFFEEGN